MFIKKAFYLIIVLAVGVLVFKPTFQTSLYGDEWKVFWIGYSAAEKTELPIPTQKGDLPYTFEVVTFYYLSKIFGYQSEYYYLISFSTRFLASLIFFWFLKRRKISDSFAFLGSLLFMTSPIGLETTDWVRNFDSYIGISLMLIAVDSILTLTRPKKSFLIIFLFLLIVFINTIRSHGVFLVLSSLLLIKLLVNKENKRIYLYTLAAISTFFGFFVNTRLFGGQIEEFSSGFPFGIFVESFLGNFGNTLIPNNPNQLLSFLVVASTLLIWKRISYLLVPYLSAAAYISVAILKAPLDFQTSVLIGGYFLAIFLVSLLWELYKKDYNSFLITAFLLITTSAFTIFPLIRIPQIHMESEHRYIVYAALATPYIVILALNEIFKKRVLLLKVVGVASVVTLVINFSIQSYQFLKLFYNSHSISYTQKVWSQITEHFENYNFTRKVPAVIILTDAETYPKVNNSAYFGFGFHFSLLYEIWKEDAIPPSWVIVGEEIDESKIPPHVIDPERDIFVFKIVDDKVEKITPMAKP